MPNANPGQVAEQLDSGPAIGEVVYLRCRVIAKTGMPDDRTYTVQVDDGKENAVAVTVGSALVSQGG